MFKLAVIGPQDMVDRSCLIAKDYSSIELLKLPYESETETAELVLKHENEADGFLFTGYLPYYQVKSQVITKKHLFYYPILGESLYRALLMIRLHHSIDISRLSIDTLTSEQVREAYHEINLDSSTILINQRKLDEFSFVQFVRFHKEAYRNGLTEAAITAINSVQVRLLEEGIPVFKVVPTINTIRRTFSIIEAARRTFAAEAAQIVVFIFSSQASNLESPNFSVNQQEQRKRALHSYLSGFAQRYRASLFEGTSDDDEFVLFISKGMFSEYVKEFADKPLISDIVETTGTAINLGIGMGRSVWEAEDNARSALLMAKSKPGSNVYMMSQDKEVTGPIKCGSECTKVDFFLRSDDSKVLLLADKTGLSVSTLSHIQGLIRGLGRDTITASELGSSMGISKRTANRVLLKLCNSGVAFYVGIEQPLPRGRPRNIYKLVL